VSCDFLVVAACIYQVCRQSRVLPRFQLVTADFRRLPALLNRFSQLLYATNFLSKLSTTFKHTAASLFQLPRPLLHFRCELDRKSKFHRCAVHPSLVHTVLDAPGFENLVRCDGFVEKDFEALKCLMLFREERVVFVRCRVVGPPWAVWVCRRSSGMWCRILPASKLRQTTLLARLFRTLSSAS
jgi:hypothetical protein